MKNSTFCEYKIFLKLKTCKFDIKNNYEVIYGYKTSDLTRMIIENNFYLNGDIVLGFSCKKCNRKVSMNHLYIERAEDYELNCDEFIIKNIIE